MIKKLINKAKLAWHDRPRKRIAKAWERCGTAWFRWDKDGDCTSSAYIHEKNGGFVGGPDYMLPAKYITPDKEERAYSTLEEAKADIDKRLEKDGWLLIDE